MNRPITRHEYRVILQPFVDQGIAEERVRSFLYDITPIEMKAEFRYVGVTRWLSRLTFGLIRPSLAEVRFRVGPNEEVLRISAHE